LLRKHGNIEKLLAAIKTEKKYQIPEDWQFDEARRLFSEPEVTSPDEIELKWTSPDEEGLVQFMAEEKGFNEDRIRNGAKKIMKSKQGATQGRMDSFFKVVPSAASGLKRKVITKNDISWKGHVVLFVVVE
jgi:flap endonuclease-1